MKNIITIIVIIFTTLFGVSCIKLLYPRIEGENKDMNWIIEMAIALDVHSGQDYLIQISENGVIRTRFGTKVNPVISVIDYDFFREVRKEEEGVLSEEELQRLISLANTLELEKTYDRMQSNVLIWGGITVVLKYNDILYKMFFHPEDLEVFRELALEIIDLTPLWVLG